MTNFINCLITIFMLFIIGSNGRILKNTPPPHGEYAKMARFLVHKSNWGAMSTLSVLGDIKGYPFANVISIADSPINQKSTGKIYYMLTNLDYTAQDLMKDNRLTLLLSMDQDKSCTDSEPSIDPMEPTCPRIMISGSSIKLEENTNEFIFGNESMYSRHPAAKNWNAAHNFFLCKLDIKQIALLDWYGGPHYINVEEYYKTVLDDDYLNNDFNLIKKLSVDTYSNNIDENSNDEDKEIHIKISKNSLIKTININYQ